MQVSKKSFPIVVGIVLFFGIVGTGLLGWNAVQKTWNDDESWTFTSVNVTKEGATLLQTNEDQDGFEVTAQSCSLYKIIKEQDGSHKFYCTLYPSRYFSSLYWLLNSSVVTNDYVVTLPKNVAMVTYNGNNLAYEDIPSLASYPKQVQLELKGKRISDENIILSKVGHYLKVKNGDTEEKPGTVTSMSIRDSVSLNRKEYTQTLFSKTLLRDLKNTTGIAAINLLVDNFKKDSSDSDKTPHFTEGLIYGLYLLSEEDPILVGNLLSELEKTIVPFHAPEVREQEISPTRAVENLESAPHTKFPLCPINDVKSMRWDSPSVKIFLSYEKSQPVVAFESTSIASRNGIYDENGNLLMYDEMIGLDALCKKIIVNKDSSQVSALSKLYQEFVNQYFVYSEDVATNSSVIEGSDQLRGVVLRGLAKDANIAKQHISLEQVKRSLFDGILWEYLYGK